MSITSIPGIQFIYDSHRCYEYALDFVVASASLGSYLDVYHGQIATSFAPVLSNGDPKYPSLLFQGNASGKNLEVIPHELLTNVLVNNTRRGNIPYLASSIYQDTIGNFTGAIAETLEGFAQAMFTNYYEKNLPSIKKAHGDRKTHQWPSVLQFAAVVRDAMSHGGIIHMFPSVPPVTHFGLTYDSASNGRKIIHNDLSCADIFFLMIEMDDAF